MEILNEKIKNKRVAILGPADYVNKELDTNHGKFINKFDTVIRLNSMIKLPDKNLEKYYGTKFDILVTGFWPFNDHKPIIKGNLNSNRFLYIDNYKDISKNLLIFDFSTESYHKKYIYDKNKNFFDKNKHITFFSYPFNFINLLRHKFNIKKSPTTGLTAILLCLLLKAKEIYISGITFYTDKKYNAYYNNYNIMDQKLYNKICENKNYIFNGKNYRKGVVFGHDVYDEANIFIKLYNENNIYIDKYLKKIIKQQFKNDNLLNINKIPIFVGSCGTIMKYIKELKLLKKTNKYIFISFQSSYYFFEEYLGFYPDYHTFLDPTGFPFREFVNNKNIKNIKTKIIIPKYLYNEIVENSYEHLHKIDKGWPAIYWEKKIWNNYCLFLKNNKNKLILINSKKVKIKPFSYIDISKNTDEFLYIYERYNNKYRHPCKLSMYIISLINYLNFDENFIIGFDSIGKRYKSLNNNHDIPKSYGYNFKNEFFTSNTFNMYIPQQIKNNNIFNLVENSNLNNYILYKNINELI